MFEIRKKLRSKLDGIFEKKVKENVIEELLMDARINRVDEEEVENINVRKENNKVIIVYGYRRIEYNNIGRVLKSEIIIGTKLYGFSMKEEEEK